MMGMRKHILEKSDTRKHNRSFHMKREQKIAHFMKKSTLRCFRLSNPLPQALLVFDIMVFGYLHSCIS